MMPPNLKAAWVEALRSGAYKQATCVLYDRWDSGFCCLGVLCDVIDPTGWDPTVIGVYHAVIDGEDVRMHDTLDERVQAALGMPEDAVIELMRLNDEEEASFDEIADVIEADPDL